MFEFFDYLEFVTMDTPKRTIPLLKKLIERSGNPNGKLFSF